MCITTDFTQGEKETQIKISFIDIKALRIQISLKYVACGPIQHTQQYWIILKNAWGFHQILCIFYLPCFLIPNWTPSFWKSSKALRRGRGKNLKLTDGVAIKLFPPLEDEVLRDISFVTVFAGAWSRARVQRLAQRRTEVLTKGKILIIWSVSFKRKHTIAFEWNDIKAKIPVISG